MSASEVPGSEIHIQEFLGIRDAIVPLPETGPVVVTGPNSSGKTSAAVAFGAILSRNHNPLGLASLKAYINDAGDRGAIILRDRFGTELSQWVVGESSVRIFSGSPEPVSRHALSLIDYLGKISPAERTKIWEPVFLPDPSVLREELETVLAKYVPLPKQRQNVLGTLTLKGWTDTEKLYREQARDAKRDWKKVAGETYGPKKASMWKPDGWIGEYDGLTELDCTSRLEASREVLRTLQMTTAVTEAAKHRSKDAQRRLPGKREELAAAEAKLAEQQQVVGQARRTSRELLFKGQQTRAAYDTHKDSRPDKDDTVPCPHPGCGLPLVIDGTVVRPGGSEDAYRAKLRNWEKGLRSLHDNLSNLRTLKIAADGKLTVERQRLATLEGRAAGLSESIAILEHDVEAGKGDLVSSETLDIRISAAEQDVRDADKALRCVMRRSEAQAHHVTAQQYAAIALALGPRGVRSTAIRSRMKALHDLVARMAHVSGWDEVELDKSYFPLIGSRPAAICSMSERWRAQFMLQAAVAILRDSPIVVADGADLLDPMHGEQLILLCDWLSEKHSLNALICATRFAHHKYPENWQVIHVSGGRTM